MSIFQEKPSPARTTRNTTTAFPKKALILYSRIPIGPLYRYDKENYLDFIGNSTLQLHDSLYKSITSPSETNNIYDILMGFYNVKYVKYEQVDNCHFKDHILSHNLIDLNVNYPNYLNIINDTETFNLSNIEINDEPVIDPSKRQKKQLIKEIPESIKSDIDDFVLV